VSQERPDKTEPAAAASLGHYSSPIRDRVNLAQAEPELRHEASSLDDARLCHMLQTTSNALEQMAHELGGTEDLQAVMARLLKTQLSPSGRLDTLKITEMVRSMAPAQQEITLRSSLQALLESTLSLCMDRVEGSQADALLAEVMKRQRELST
jgi:DNA-binding transcriptional regulator YbjK